MNDIARIIVALVMASAFLVGINIVSESSDNTNPTYDNPDTQPVYHYNRTAEPPKGSKSQTYARDDKEPDDDLDNNQYEDNGDY